MGAAPFATSRGAAWYEWQPTDSQGDKCAAGHATPVYSLSVLPNPEAPSMPSDDNSLLVSYSDPFPLQQCM